MSSPSRVRQRHALVALNVTLLTLVAIVTFAPISQAQPTSSRARGDYSMVAGEISGGRPFVTYIFDASNNEMVAVRWNSSRNLLDGIGYRDLEADSKIQNQGGPR